MTNLFKKAALAATVAALATPAMAANGNPATSTGTAKVRILQPLSINNTNGTLDFGVLVKSATVAPASFYNFDVSTAGTFGGCDAAWACSATKSAANFSVSGAAGESVEVQIDPSVDLDATATPYLNVALALSGAAAGVYKNTLTLTGGTANFSVGGTLTVRGDVPTGTYAQPFNVTAIYQ